MAATHFSGPVMTGTKSAGETGGPNQGYVVLSQTASITQDSTNAVSASFNIPANAQIINVLFDVTTAFDSATSATGTVGTSAGDSSYAGSVNAKTAGRASISFTGAQLAAMADVGANTTVVATITPSGATTAGAARVTLVYAQK